MTRIKILCPFVMCLHIKGEFSIESLAFVHVCVSECNSESDISAESTAASHSSIEIQMLSLIGQKPSLNESYRNRLKEASIQICAQESKIMTKGKQKPDHAQGSHVGLSTLFNTVGKGGGGGVTENKVPLLGGGGCHGKKVNDWGRRCVTKNSIA